VSQFATLTFSLLDASPKGSVVRDSVYRFAAGSSDAGVYADSVLLSDGTHKDTLRIYVRVNTPSILPTWQPDTLSRSVRRSDSLLINLRSLVPNIAQLGALTFSLLDASPKGSVVRDSIYHFVAGATDEGVYVDSVLLSDGVHKDTLSISVIVTTTTVPPVWKSGTISCSLNEGDSVTVLLPDSVVNRLSSGALTFALLGTAHKGRLITDSLYRYAAGRRDSGQYVDSIVFTQGQFKDTVRVAVSVAPRYVTLTITTPQNGSITKNPNQTQFRWADTVTLTAVPNATYELHNWTGDVSDDTTVVKLVMTSNKTVGASFAIPGCRQTLVPGVSSLSEAMQAAWALPAANRPIVICAPEGLYDMVDGKGTIEVQGRVELEVGGQ
jgi:hypothetical protein